MIPTIILLVEDDLNDVFFFEKALLDAGVSNPVQVVNDGQEALDYLEGAGKFSDRQKHPLPRLIFLDLKLPRVMGLEVLRRIRGQPGLRKLIVLILTSSISERDIANAYDLGANAYLVKPAEPSQLGSMVRAVKDFWLTHNHPAPVSAPALEKLGS